MKRVIVGILLGLSLLAQQRQAESLGTFTAVSAGTAVSLRAAISKHTVSVVVTGGPSACTIRLEGSIDNTTFFDLSGAQTCTASVMFHVVDKPVTQVRANLATLTGGTAPTLVVRYLGTN